MDHLIATPMKPTLDLSRVFRIKQDNRTSPSVHRGFTGRTPFPAAPESSDLPSEVVVKQPRPQSARVPQQTVQLSLAVEGMNLNRPHTARIRRPAARQLPNTPAGPPSSTDKEEHATADQHRPQPPAKRPQTARPALGRRTITSAKSNSSSKPVRPHTARASQTIVTQIQAGQASGETGSTTSRSRKPFSARPLSAVPIIQPSGVSAQLLKEVAPEHYELNGACKSAAKTLQVKDDAAFQKLTKAILRGEPLPMQEQPAREPSPVRWHIIEEERPLAACERKILQKQQTESQPSKTAPRSVAAPRAAPVMWARPVKQRAKFSRLDRPSRNQLRRQLNEHEVAATAEAEGRMLLRERPLAQHPADEEAKDEDPRLEQMVVRLQQPDDRIFLTQTDIENVPTAKQEPVAARRKAALEHLDPATLAHAVDRLPLACDGRLLVSAELKQVLAKREPQLQERVRQIFAAKEQEKLQANTGHALRANIADSTTLPADKRARAAARAEARAERAVEASRRRAEQEEAFREQTLRKLEMRELAIKQQEAEEARQAQEGHRKMLLATLALGRSMQLFQERMALWLERKPFLQRRRAASRIISACWKKYLLRKYASRRAEAMMRLASMLRAAVARWRVRYRNKQAAIVVHFLRQVGQAARFQLAVKLFKGKVDKAQSLVRRHLAITRSRYELLELQWNKVDQERIQKFNEKRAAMLKSIRSQLDRTIELKGNAKSKQLQRMKLIESYGGARKVRECKAELEESRRQYAEYFLPPEMREVPPISQNVKRRMLRHYVKRFRAKYTQDWELYTRQLHLWTQLNQTKQLLHHDLCAPPRRASSSQVASQGMAAPLAGAAAELTSVAPGAPPPTSPNALIVLPPHVMAQIVLKAVETTRQLSRKALESLAGSPPPKQI